MVGETEAPRGDTQALGEHANCAQKSQKASDPGSSCKWQEQVAALYKDMTDPQYTRTHTRTHARTHARTHTHTHTHTHTFILDLSVKVLKCSE